MFNALFLSYKVAFTQSVNHFFYYLKKIPFIGKIFSDEVYKKTTLKVVVGAVVECFKLLLGFFLSALAMGIFVLGPMYILDKQISNMDLFSHYFFFFYFMAGPIMTNTIFTTQDVQSYTLVQILRINKRDFYLSKILFTLLIKVLRYVVILFFIDLFLGFDSLEFAALLFYIISMVLVWEGLVLLVFDNKKCNIYKKPFITIGSVLAMLAISYSLPYMGVILNMQNLMFNPTFILVIFLMAVIAITKLYVYKDYNKVANEMLSRENVFQLANIMQDAKFADVNLDEKALELETVDAKDTLEGYNYFNYLFFTRHGSILKKPIRNRAIILGILTIFIWGVLIIKTELREPAVDLLKSISPYLIFLMYFISTGEKFSRALFFNCDRYMLKEGYYKEKEAILSNFTIRLIKIVSLNMIPAAIISVLIVGVGIIGGLGSDTVLFPIIVTVFSLALFFSTHYLFLYYILQPYTKELTSKSPLFTIINGLVYFATYGLMQVRTSSVYFTMGVLTFTVTYVLLAILFTYKFAPTTFRLK